GRTPWLLPCLRPVSPSGSASPGGGLDHRTASLRDQGAAAVTVLGHHHGEAHEPALLARLLVAVDQLVADFEHLAGPGRRAVEDELLLAVQQPLAVEADVHARALP